MSCHQIVQKQYIDDIIPVTRPVYLTIDNIMELSDLQQRLQTWKVVDGPYRE